MVIIFINGESYKIDIDHATNDEYNDMLDWIDEHA